MVVGVLDGVNVRLSVAATTGGNGRGGLSSCQGGEGCEDNSVLHFELKRMKLFLKRDCEMDFECLKKREEMEICSVDGGRASSCDWGRK